METPKERPLNLLDNIRTSPSRYSSDYKNAVFLTWYSHGKCSGQVLSGYIEPDVDGIIPSDSTLQTWVHSDEFLNRAAELDSLVRAAIDSQAVSEKVEMLTRHAQTGKTMQDLALAYLKDHADDLKTQTAVRMLVDGIRIERESRGLPSLITEAIDQTDEEIMSSIEKLLSAVEVSESGDGEEQQ